MHINAINRIISKAEVGKDYEVLSIRSTQQRGIQLFELN